MASKKAEAVAEAPAKPKRVIKKREGLRPIQLELSCEGNKHIHQSVAHIRYQGVFVTTTLLDAKGLPISVATTWVPGLKPKSKGGQRSLVIDKGPKVKKPKKEKEEKSKK